MKHFNSKGKKKPEAKDDSEKLKRPVKLKPLPNKIHKNWKNHLFQEDDSDEEEIFLNNRKYDDGMSED
jgi:hypothetical protein